METAAIRATTVNVTCARTFTETYIDYASNLTDAPDIYHKFLALDLLSLAVGRTPIRITPNRLYPNIWMILIGTSGVTRKTSAMKLAISILPDDYKYLPNDFTPEALQQTLSEQSQGLIWKEEIGGFLENIKKREYMGGTPDLLCQLFDCPARYSRSLRKEKFDINDVCFNIIAATTPSRFLDTVKLADFDRGFQSRFLIVVGLKTRSQKRRKWTETDTEKLEACRTKWKQIHDIFHGEESHNLSFEFESEALELANSWSEREDAEVMACSTPREADLKGAIATRMADYLVKLAALYEVDNISKTNVSRLVTPSISISKESVAKACLDIDNLLTQLTNNLLTLLTEDNVSTKLEKLTNTIKAKADHEGWVQHRVLLQFMNVTAKELLTLIQTAYEREMIEYKKVGRAMYYRLQIAEKSKGIEAFAAVEKDEVEQPDIAAIANL